MAPSPQHDSEPKAPDKSGAAAAQPAVDNRAPPSPAPAGVQLAESKHVGGLDDGALRALLDEAITYKCPKDREGKSLLFKELLEEAEQDEEACGGAGGGGGGWRGGREAARGRRGGGRRGERLPHSGSLQDLVAAALAADVPQQRRRPHAPVSARTHHGGSLPSGVDRSFLLGEEPVRGGGGGGADYIATVRCVNPPPLTERRVSVSDAHNATEMELLNRRSKIPCIPVTYTSRATLDISSGGRAHTTTTCSNQVRTPRAPAAPTAPAHPEGKTRTSRPQPDTSSSGGTGSSSANRLLDSLEKPMMSKKRRKKAPRKLETSKWENYSRIYLSNDTPSTIFAPALLYEPSGSVDQKLKTPFFTEVKKIATQFQKPFCRKFCLENSPGKQLKETATSDQLSSSLAVPYNTSKVEDKIFAKTLVKPGKFCKDNPSGKYLKEHVKETTTSDPLSSSSAMPYNTSNLEDKIIGMTSQKPGKFCQENALSKQLKETATSDPLRSSPAMPFNTSYMEDKKIAKTSQKPGKFCQTNALEKHLREKTSYPLSSSPAAPCNTSNVKDEKSPTKSHKNDKFCYDNTPKKHLKETATSYPLRSSPAVPFNTSNLEDKKNPEKSHKLETFCYANTLGKHVKETATSDPLSSSPDMLYNTSNDCAPHVRREATVRINKNSNRIGDQFQGDIFSNESLKKISDSIALNFHVGYPSGPLCNNRGHNLQKTSLEKSGNVYQAAQEMIPTFYPEKSEEDVLKQNFVQLSQIHEMVYEPSCSRQLLMRREPTIGPPEVLFSRQQCRSRTPVVRKPLGDTKSLRFQKDPQHSIPLSFVSPNPKTNLNLNAKNTAKLEPGIDKFIKKSTVALGTINENQTSESVVQGSEHDYEHIQCSIRKNTISQYGSNWEYPKLNSYFSHSSNHISTDNFDTSSINFDVASPGSLNGDRNTETMRIAFMEDDFDLNAEDLDNCGNESNVYKCTQAVNLYKKYLTNSDYSGKVVASVRCSSDQATMHKSDTAENDGPILPPQDTIIGTESDLLNVSTEKAIEHESEEFIISSEKQAVNSLEFSCTPKTIQEIQIDADIVDMPNNDPSNPSVVDVGRQTYLTPITFDSQINLHIIDELEDVPKQLQMSRSAVLLNLVRHHYGNNNSVVMHINNGSSRSDTSINIQKTTEQVDSGITFGCITTPAVVTSCNTTSSAPSPCASVDSKPRAGGALATGSINGLAALSRNYGGCSSADDFKKSLDENGNALQTFNSPLSGSSQHKKPRRKKSSKNETVAMSEQIDGYQGNKEINELLRFIESDAEHGRAHKHKQHDKRSTERRARDKAKLQRANSMEELSLSKLEDLTHDKGKGEPLALRKHKKERVSDGGATDARKSERRSWGDEARAPFYHSNSEEPPAAAAPAAAPLAAAPASAAPATAAPAAAPAARDKKKPKSGRAAEWPPEAEPPVESLEFQTVTKKKRTRKRHSPQSRGAGGGGGGGGGGGERAGDHYRKMRPSTPERRRKSAPPSDKSSNDDDLDSVHSLPAEPTGERCAARPGSASSGGTPQASYADIARTRHNIPDLIESCNFYTDLEPLAGDDAPAAKKDVCRSDSAPLDARRSPPKASDEPSGPAYDADNYPALDARAPRVAPRAKDTRHAEAKPPPIESLDRKPKSEAVAAAEERGPPFERKAAAAAGREGGGGEEAAAAGAEPPDVVLAPDRRPPVILLDEASRPREMDGITFGFDINEQLLNGGEREEAPFPSSDEFPAINEKRARARCELVRECAGAAAAAAVAVAVGGRAALRYVPPAPLAHAHHHHLSRIVNYVGAAWEDIMKCPGGEVRYFSQ